MSGPDGTKRVVVYWVDNQCFECERAGIVQQIVQKMTLPILLPLESALGFPIPA